MSEPEAAPGVSVAEYAARLRLIRNMGGCLLHPRAFEVFEDDAAYWNAYDAWRKLVEHTCSDEDAYEFAQAQVARTIVRRHHQTEKLVFAYEEGD